MRAPVRQPEGRHDEKVLGQTFAVALIIPTGVEAAQPYACGGAALGGGAQLICSHIDPTAPPQSCNFFWSLMTTDDMTSVVQGTFLLERGKHRRRLSGLRLQHGARKPGHPVPKLAKIKIVLGAKADISRALSASPIEFLHPTPPGSANTSAHGGSSPFLLAGCCALSGAATSSQCRALAASLVSRPAGFMSRPNSRWRESARPSPAKSPASASTSRSSKPAASRPGSGLR